jgi:hypothetical protein
LYGVRIDCSITRALKIRIRFILFYEENEMLIMWLFLLKVLLYVNYYDHHRRRHHHHHCHYDKQLLEGAANSKETITERL